MPIFSIDALKQLRLDSDQLWATISRISVVGGGLLNLAMVAVWLSPVDQGLYYTLNSLVALQVFVELGCGQVAILSVARQMPFLRWNDGQLSGTEDAKAQIAIVLKVLTGWYAIMGVVFCLILIPSGRVFLLGNETLSATNRDILNVVWPLLCLITFGALIVGGVLNVLEGAGRVAEVAKIRIVAQAIAVAVFGLAILGGLGLFSMVLHGAALIVCILTALLITSRQFLSNLIGIKARPNRAMLSDLFRLQWRVALSWISGYFVFQIPIPILYKFEGAAAAGQYGLTAQIFSAASGVLAIMVSSKLPQMAFHGAAGRRHETRKIFTRAALLSVGLLAAALSFLLVLQWHPYVSDRLSGRILPYPGALFLVISTFLAHIVTILALFVRSHRQEPFVLLSCANAVFTIALLLILVPRFAANGAALAQALASGLLSLPVAWMIFRRYWDDRPLSSDPS